MKDRKWKARTKRELIIEVWEALDCESVGAAELIAIGEAVRERFGLGAVESHTSVARLLADEGAELRHPEVLELDVLQRTSDPYAERFRGILEIVDLDSAVVSIQRFEELRKTFAAESDPIGLRRVREMALEAKRRVGLSTDSNSDDVTKGTEMAEIVEWLAVWLRQPEIFEMWLDLRRASEDFRTRFGSAVDNFQNDV